MRIAPDLDKLMWNIADSGEASAAESFQNRFPELKHELANRMHVVQDIKNAKALHSGVPPRPEFRIKQANAFKPSWRLVTITALLLGAALVFAVSYSIFRANQSAVSRVPLAKSADPCIVPSAVVPPKTQSGVAMNNHLIPAKAQPSLSINDHASPEAPPNPLTSTTAQSGAAGQRLIMKGVPLSAVLRTISQQYGLKIDTSPGFPDPSVSIDLEGKDAKSLLRAVGAQYSFGVVEEGDKAVLLVPQGAFVGKQRQ